MRGHRNEAFAHGRLWYPRQRNTHRPHARHTTTNFRNAARLIYRYGLPFEKQALVTAIPSQVRIIDQKRFEQRCTRELGYQPQRIVKRLSPFDLIFLPQIESLQIDPHDPLDP